LLKRIKMKLAIVASLIAGAAAFAPSKQSIRSSALNDSPYENEIGVVAPTGFFGKSQSCRDGKKSPCHPLTLDYL
jgi:hypothetical protein